LRDRRGRRRQDSAEERPRDHAVGHPRHQQDGPGPARRREPGRHGARLPADARRPAVRVHQLQDRRWDRRTGRARPPRLALRSPRAAGRARARVTALGDARELARYQDQPRQLRAGTPGKRPHLALRFERRDGRSVLSAVEHRAPLLAQQALYWDEGMPDLPCVFIVSTSGGILQGDRATIQIELGPGPRAHVTTQAPTNIHATDANSATQSQEITLGEGAYLEYLPDVLIPFRHARFLSRTLIRIAPTAVLLCAEVVMPGRKHHAGGEAFAYDVFSSAV